MAELAESIALLALAVGLLLALTPPGRRTLDWMLSQYSSQVEASTTKLSDFVSLTTFGVTVAGILVSYFMLNLQNKKDNLDSEIRSLSEKKAGLEQEARDQATTLPVEFAPGGVDVHLETPTADTAVIHQGSPDLRWQYARHTDRVNYVVEVIRLASAPSAGDLEKWQEVPGPPCNFDKYPRCRFYALDPTAQQSAIPLAPAVKKQCSENVKECLSGQFLWRVVPAKSRLSRPDSVPAPDPPLPLDFVPLSEWSEYGSFSVYPSLLQRVTERKVLVGTTYSDNTQFSSIDGHGHYTGYDLDLIQLLIDYCIHFDANGLSYDPKACEEEIASYSSSKLGAEFFQQTNRASADLARIRAFPSVDAGLAALHRKEIDLFIGALTKAKERETPGVKFTPGYYPFQTALYGHEARGQELKKWAAASISGKTIGVIENSTNHWLASALSGEGRFGNKLMIKPYASYTSLKSAFDRYEIDAVLMDNVLGDSLMIADQANVSKIGGLQSTHAWSEYIHRLDNKKKEEFAIAVAVDSSCDTDDGAGRKVARFFHLEMHPRTGTLCDALSDALESQQVKNLRRALEDFYLIGSSARSEGAPPRL